MPLDPQAILYRANRIYAKAHCRDDGQRVEQDCKDSYYITGDIRAAIQAIVEAINNQQQKEKE